MTIAEKLDAKRPVKLFDHKSKQFVQIQINREFPEFWQRYVSKDKSFWVKINEQLTREEVEQVLTEIKANEK